MSTYKEINGQKVQYLASDPPNSHAGQVWYNSTSGTLKFNNGAAGSAWATGGSLNAARGDGGGVGTATDALGFQGQQPASPGYANATESYNGTSWTTQPTTNTRAFQMGQSGTSTSALGFGGYVPGSRTTATESYNGTWTTQPTMTTARYGLGGVGASNTEALGFGGYTSAFAVNVTESYNGSSPNMVNGGSGVMGTGPVTATLAAGGSPGGTYSESYNGSWTSLNTMPTSRVRGGMTGTTTAAVIFGGNDNVTNVYNGTNWTTSATLNTGHPEALGRAGSSNTNALIFGGASGINTTETLNSTGGIRELTVS